MRAAVLHALGSPPRVEEFDDPGSVVRPGETVVEVAAAGLSHLDLGKAAGKVKGQAPALPYVPGTDGVGRCPDGRRVYFHKTVSPYGAFAERTLVADGWLADVPDGVTDEVAAALGNAGVAAMTALESLPDLDGRHRVLVMGATGAVGQVAVQLGKALGASRVVAAGLGADRLDRLRELGADATVDLGTTGGMQDALLAQGPFDLIVDLLWGAPSLAAMHAAAPEATLVQFGELAGSTIELPAALLRSKQLRLLGVSGFQAPAAEQVRRYERVTSFAASGRIEVDLEAIPLAQIDRAWEQQGRSAAWKLVIIP